jgi:hypothetical protein
VSRVAWAIVAAVLALATVCCSADSAKKPDAKGTPTPAPSRTPDAVTPPPAPGRAACYRLTVTQLTEPTNDSSPVPCARRHTAQTIFVGRLALVRDGHAIRVDSPRVQQQVAKACPRRLATYLGGGQEDRDLSRFRVVWFSPTLAEADAGARWFRCDLVAFGTDDKLYAQKGRVASGVLGGAEGVARYGLCGTASPGATGFKRVLCGMGHSWRAISTIALAGSGYPGEAAARDGGGSNCKDQVRAAQNFALTFTYGWEWPTRAQWRAGQHFGYCWAPD